MKTNAVTRSRWAHWRFALPLLAFASASLQAQDSQVNFIRRGRWPGFERGSALGVAPVGQHAYVTVDEAEVLILDISTPAQPVWRGSVNVGADPSDITTAGNHVYVIHGTEVWMAPWPGGGLVVLDVSEPLNPVRVGALETGYSATYYPRTVHVSGDYAYLLCGDSNFCGGGLEVIDIHDPAQPVRIGNLAITEQISDSDFAGNYAYVATGGGLWVLDLRNPPQPTVAVANCGEGIFKWSSVAAAGNHAYLTAGDLGLGVLDVSHPANPNILSFYPEFTNGGRHVQIAGSYAYLQTGQGFDVIDVSDPTHLTRVGRCVGTPGGKFQIVGDYGYSIVGDYSLGIAADAVQVIHLAEPVNPVVVGGFVTAGVAHQLRVVENLAYVADGSSLQVIDVSNPGRPVGVGSFFWGSYGGCALDVADGYAYVAGYDPALPSGHCFDVIEVSNPAAPKRAGRIDPQWSDVLQIQLAGGYAYCSGVVLGGNFCLIDVGNPTQPVLQPGLPLGTWPFPGISVTGAYLYAAHDGDRGTGERLTVFDLSVPGSPARVGGATTRGRGSALEVVGHYAYVGVSMSHDTDTLNGLEVFDLSRPETPVSVGACEISIAPGSIQVQGQYAYLTGQSLAAPDQGWLEVIDLKDPTKPQRIGTCEFTGGSFQVLGNLIYVADGAWGLTILEVELPGTLKLKPPVLSGNTLTLSWNGGPGIRLQKTASLTTPNWQDVPNSDGTSQLSLPPDTGAAFYRLVQP